MSFPTHASSSSSSRGRTSSFFSTSLKNVIIIIKKRHLYRNEARSEETTDDDDETSRAAAEKGRKGRTFERCEGRRCVFCVRFRRGPAGLTTALAIQKLVVPTKDTRVVLFDKNPNAMDGNLGGGFNINGGAAVLEKLGVYDEVFSENANKLRGVLSRRCDKDRTRLFEVDVEEEVRSDFLTTRKSCW